MNRPSARSSARVTAAIALAVAGLALAGCGSGNSGDIAAGKTMVAPAVGGIPEIVAGTDTALIPPGSVPALVSALNATLADPEAARAKALRLRANVERKFTVAGMTSEILAFYAAAKAAPKVGAGDTAAPVRIDIAGIKIANAQLTWRDEKAGTTTTLSNLDFGSGRVQADSGRQTLAVEALSLAAKGKTGADSFELKLDVPRPHDLLLHEDSVVTERRTGLCLGLREGIRELIGRVDSAHAFAAASGRGFEHHRKPH